MNINQPSYRDRMLSGVYTWRYGPIPWWRCFIEYFESPFLNTLTLLNYSLETAKPSCKSILKLTLDICQKACTKYSILLRTCARNVQHRISGFHYLYITLTGIRSWLKESPIGWSSRTSTFPCVPLGLRLLYFIHNTESN